ncbi:hypothetical protein VspSTUT11_03600 [Vibrio sp. STUT-A11]|nr:hypothetical protein VspSTUT11_03600 [Vibrio sp. STUT-A11]
MAVVVKTGNPQTMGSDVIIRLACGRYSADIDCFERIRRPASRY